MLYEFRAQVGNTIVKAVTRDESGSNLPVSIPQWPNRMLKWTSVGGSEDGPRWFRDGAQFGSILEEHGCALENEVVLYTSSPLEELKKKRAEEIKKKAKLTQKTKESEV